MDLSFSLDDIRELDGALCYTEHHDPALWHPEDAEGKGGGRNSAVARMVDKKAKAICRRCPVRALCLDQALRANQQYGIYGGMTADERAELKGGAA